PDWAPSNVAGPGTKSAVAKTLSSDPGGHAASTETPGALISGLTWPIPNTGPRELKPAISPMNESDKKAFSRIGNSDTAPFSGATLLSSVDEIASVRILASATEIVAAGIMALTAVAFWVSSIRITPMAPLAAACITWSPYVAPRTRFTRAMRPE